MRPRYLLYLLIGRSVFRHKPGRCPFGVAMCCSVRDFAPKMGTSSPPGEMATSLASKWLLSAGLPTGRWKPPCRWPPRAKCPLRRSVQIPALTSVVKCDRPYFPVMEMPGPLSNAAAVPRSPTPWTKINIEAMTFKRSRVDCGQVAEPLLRDAHVPHSGTRAVPLWSLARLAVLASSRLASTW